MSTNIVILDGYTLNPGDLSWGPFERLGTVTVYDRSGPLAAERAGSAPVVLTNKDPLSAEVIISLTKLRYIGVLATGTNVVDLDAATEQGVVVTNVPAYGAASVSQHVFALLLDLTNRVGQHRRALHDGQWSSCPDFSFTIGSLVELDGKTLGIVGLGAIGARVAQIGVALGMKVVAADSPSGRRPTVPGVEIEWLALDDVFARSDVITLHCPLTNRTLNLVNRERLALMKDSAFLINTGRGPLVDESALAEALGNERLGGAALDVLVDEPPAADHPLIGLPNCVVTPHLAWATREARGRLLQIAADNLEAFLEGRPQNVVNPEVLG